MKQSGYSRPQLINLLIFSTIIVELFGELLNIKPLRLIKIIPIYLMIYNISMQKVVKDQQQINMIKYGLVLSSVGDFLLMFNELLYFMIGTGFFLVAHLLYCAAAMVGEKTKETTPKIKRRMIIGCVILILMLASNIYTLWDVMPNRFLFTLYGGVLCLINILCVVRYEKTTWASYVQMLIGSLLFGISDNLLAMLKFNGVASNLGRTVVMFTYYFGQYFIMHGSINHSTLKN